MGKFIAFCALAVCAVAAPAFAGAWLQPQGQGLFIAQTSYFTNDEFYNRSGEVQQQARYNKYEFQPYMEYGLLPNLTIGGTAYLQHVEQSSITNYGLADPEIFLRSRLWYNDKSVVSIQPLVKFRSRFDRDTPPRGGSSSTDAEVSLLYGRNLHLVSPRDYLDMRVGYRFRGNRLNDQIRADAALGLEVAPDWQVIPAVRTVHSAEIRKGAAFVESGDMDYNMLKLELGLSYRLSPTQAVGLAVYDHVDGKQTGNGQGITLSYARQF